MNPIRLLPLAFVAASALVAAQPFGPPDAGRVPSPEALATLPGLSTAQQTELRRILLERRDQLEAVMDKARTEMQAQHKRLRTERERIDEQTAEKLRKALGEDGYRAYAEWRRATHGQRGPGAGRPHGPGGEGRGGPGRGEPHPPAAAPGGPGAPLAALAPEAPDDMAEAGDAD